jgi:D-glycero-alpha-D-manno-heptose-7-phosphate kinase
MLVMIVSRTPLRMSFSGGGTDLPSFYERFGGAVVSTTIDKYVFVTCRKSFDGRTRFAYSKVEDVAAANQIEHGILNAAAGMLGIHSGIQIATISDVPTQGTGLGSSSSLAVGLLNALHALRRYRASPDELARQACRVELDLCGQPIGKQDQYAAAYGGLNLVEFKQDGGVQVSPILLSEERRQDLMRRIIVFFTGMTRNSSELLRVQTEGIIREPGRRESLLRMTRLSYMLRSELENGNIEALGSILDEGWHLKRSLAKGISNPQIDDWYHRARLNGAYGGKILGAGAGGFLLFYADESKHRAIADSLQPLQQVNVGFERLGSRILLDDAT